MRVRIIHKFTSPDVDVRLDRFQPGLEYDVDSAMGSLFVAEGWAEPAASKDFVVPVNGAEPDLPSLKDAAAADIALDDAIAAALDRRLRRHHPRLASDGSPE